jgi:hypothetical protein
MSRHTAVTYAVLKTVLAIIAAAALAFHSTGLATMALMALVGLFLIPECTRGFLRVQEQRHSFLLEQERLAIERDRLKLQWRARQQETYELQIMLENEGVPASTSHELKRRSRNRARRYNQPALQLIGPGGNVLEGESEIAQPLSAEQPDYEAGRS